METLANNLRIRSEAVNHIRKKEGFSIAFLKEVTTFVTYMNGQAASAILACKQDTSAGSKSFKLVINEYLRNSEQLLDFCLALDKFVKSARGSHEYTQYVVQQYFDNKMDAEYCLKILEKLKNLKSSSSDEIHDYSAQDLHQKIKALIVQFEKLCTNLKQEIEKIDQQKIHVSTRQRRSSIGYKTVSTICVICAGLVGMDFLPDLVEMVSSVGDAAFNTTDVASSVSDATTFPNTDSLDATALDTTDQETHYAAKAGITAVLAIPIAVGRTSLMSHYNKKQKGLDEMKNIMNAKHDESKSSIAELRNIEFGIDQVVNEIDSLMARTNTAIRRSDIDFLMKDMKQKLEMFMTKINQLDAEAVKCSTETLKARDDVCNKLRFYS